MYSSRSLLVALLLGASAIPTQAQQGGDRTWGFATAGTDTRSADYVYAAYGAGRGFALVGASANHRTGSSGYAVGAGARLEGHGSHLVIAGASVADDVWYGQLYWLPSVRAGDAAVRATIVSSLPLAHRGRRSLAVAPLSLTTRLAAGVQGGLSTHLVAKSGERRKLEAGPELRFAIARTGFGVEALRRVDEPTIRLRVTAVVSF